MKRLLPAALALTLAIAGSASAGQFYGGKAFLHTNTATVLPPGALDLSLYMRGFTGPVEGADFFTSNGTSALAASFGFSRRIELGFTQILYQDLNNTRRADKTVTTMIPGNTYIRIKAAGYPVGDNMFWGVLSALRYRVGRYQDVEMEPYQSYGIEMDITGMASYYVKPLYPDEAASFHLNLGVINHNDAESIGDASIGMNYLVSAMFPRPRYDYGVELYGNAYLSQPPDTVLSRESWLYVAPMLRYKLFKGLSFTAGLDLLVIGSSDETVGTPDDRYPNYAPWRLSMKVALTPSTAFYAAPTFVKADAAGGTGRERRTFGGAGSGGGDSGGAGGGNSMFSRQELFRWGIEERGSDIQSVDLDLEKLRQERKKAEEELKALKAKLEEKQKTENK